MLHLAAIALLGALAGQVEDPQRGSGSFAARPPANGIEAARAQVDSAGGDPGGAVALIEAVRALGDTLDARCRFSEAAGQRTRVIVLCEENFGEDHFQTALALTAAGMTSLHGADYGAAAEYLKRALVIREKLDPRGLQTAQSLLDLAACRRRQERLNEAGALYVRAMVIYEQVEPRHPRLIESLDRLIEILDEQKKYAESSRLVQRALELCEEVYGPEHLLTAAELNELARLFGHLKTPEQGVPLYERARQIAGPPADLILLDGLIWTVDDELPRAEALAVRDERIVSIGPGREMLALRGPQTRVIDLGGKFVLPGFVDNHLHFASAARFLEFNLMQTASQEELVERVRELVGTLEPGEWILGGYWGAYDAWSPGSDGGQGREPFTPDIALIEELTRENPLFIQRFDGGEFAVNKAACDAAQLDPTRTTEDVEFVLNGEGLFTGILRGPGVPTSFESAIPERPYSHARRLAQTRRALERTACRGVTTVSDMSDDEQLAIYEELRESGELTLRIHFRHPLERWKELADEGIRVGSGDDWIRLGCLKGHIDGIMGNSTARFFEPYAHDPGNRGRWRKLMLDEEGDFAEGQFLQYMLDADRAGLQLSVHAIGDEANHLLLDYLDELRRTNGERDRRFRLVHAQVIAPEDFQRLEGVVAEVQPFHLIDDMRWMEERIGEERSRGAYAFESIAASGAVLCFGTDWPGTSASEYPIDPLPGLHAAVTRCTLAGRPAAGWFPEQRIGMEEALRAYTLNSAYANFEESGKGSITVGKLADLVVLSENLLAGSDAALTAEVLATIVGGRFVYGELDGHPEGGEESAQDHDDHEHGHDHEHR